MVQERSKEILNNARTRIDEQLGDAKRQKTESEKLLREQQKKVDGLSQKIAQLIDARRQIDLDIGPPRGNQPS